MTSLLMRYDAANCAEEPDVRLSHRPIDLVHLSLQSLGDRALETELLQLFDRQAEQIAARLMSDIAGGELRWRRDLCHTLKGSARAVGAGRVAAAAAAYEQALFAQLSPKRMEPIRAELAAAIAQARAAISDLLLEL